MSVTVVPKGQTQSAGGVASAPANNASFVALTPGSGRTWLVIVLAGYGAGTAPAAAENANVRLRHKKADGTFDSDRVLAVPGAVGVVPFTFIIDTASATDTLELWSIAAPTGGVNYVGGIYAVPAS